MTTATTAIPASGEAQVPKLLLDTNVYLDLADGLLPTESKRLEAIAAHRDPPLLWTCQIPFDELVCRTSEGGPTDFLRYRAALRWMDDLCEMAEPLWWVLRRAVFVAAGPKDDELAQALVEIRQEILRAETYDQLPAHFKSAIDALRAQYTERIDAWVKRRTRMNGAAREKVKPGERGIRDTVLASNAVSAVLRKYVEADATTWGPLRAEEDQKHAQREVIAFEVSLLRKALNPAGYNHAKRRSDYNDYWLCAYPAAGYTIVTREKRLPDALKQGECVDPRMVSLETGIAIAEAWLARA